MLAFIEVPPHTVDSAVCFQHGACLTVFDAVFDGFAGEGVDENGRKTCGLILRMHGNEKHLQGVVFSLQSPQKTENAEGQQFAIGFFQRFGYGGDHGAESDDTAVSVLYGTNIIQIYNGNIARNQKNLENLHLLNWLMNTM